MAFFKLITLLAVAASVTAGAIPREAGTGTYSHAPDAPNGFYIHSLNAAGEPENIFVGEVLPIVNATVNHTTAAAALLAARKLYQGQIICKNQYTLNYNDLIAAEQGLENMFANGGSFGGKSVSYKSPSAVAYGCNYGHGQTITGTWLAAQFGNIATACGSSSPGWVAYPDWKAAYGVDGSGVGFC
ncbi:hypothetical protein B0H63DRAFT_187805 [Podospora didyma]|uniref:Uncharacterized protein n=1 Tax=Podospora didyma TaxID=330526 RepID=A0AAE0NQE8_9PEZI|nr:hypothetical protein B0H63DRAFT_187805 [Podospora didyma]